MIPKWDLESRFLTDLTLLAQSFNSGWRRIALPNYLFNLNHSVFTVHYRLYAAGKNTFTGMDRKMEDIGIFFLIVIPVCTAFMFLMSRETGKDE